MPIIDVHTHMFTTRWLELLRANGGIYNIKTRPDGQREGLSAPRAEAGRWARAAAEREVEPVRLRT